MAAFLVPRAATLLPPATSALVSRFWEIEAVRATHEEL